MQSEDLAGLYAYFLAWTIRVVESTHSPPPRVWGAPRARGLGSPTPPSPRQKVAQMVGVFGYP